MSFCKNCGQVLEKNESITFCSKCGQNISEHVRSKNFKKIITLLGISGTAIILALSFLFLTSSGEKLRMQFIGVDILAYSGLTGGETYKMKNTFITKDGTRFNISTITNNGKKVIDGRSTYQVNRTNYDPKYDYKTEMIQFYKHNNKEIVMIGYGKSEDDIKWNDEEEAGYYLPSKMKIGKEYSHQEEDEIRTIVLDSIQDLQIGDHTFENCLLIKERWVGEDGQVSLTSEYYLAQGIGYVKYSDKTYFKGEVTHQTKKEYME
jgi:hypothetical protein